MPKSKQDDEIERLGNCDLRKYRDAISGLTKIELYKDSYNLQDGEEYSEWVIFVEAWSMRFHFFYETGKLDYCHVCT